MRDSNLTNPYLPYALTALLAFASGALLTKVTQDNKAESVDYSRLTTTTCVTDEECHIAEAIAFYEEYKFPETIPILEPVDCSDLKGKERATCEKSNRDNAGKPATYPAICEPYIYKAPKE